MRSTFLAISVALMVGVAMPASAAVKHHASTPTPSFDTCEALAVERDAAPQQGGNSSNPYIQYNTFMRACVEGKVPLSKSGG